MNSLFYLYYSKFCISIALVLFALTFAFNVVGQSTDQLYPTPVRTNEINGTIKARDIGDARLTTYFYTFEGEQGDLFVNVQTANFTGDIDIFIAAGLRPLTKMVMYSDISESETGRVIYLRKPETLLLRIQGRTPGDETASFRIKFAGTFAASKAEDITGPEIPKVNTASNSGIRVNSVGTIIEVVPKPKPTPQESSAAVKETRDDEKDKVTDVVSKAANDDSITKTGVKSDKESEESEADKHPKPEVIITDPVVPEEKKVVAKNPVRPSRRTRNNRAAKPKKEPEKEVAAAVEPSKSPEPEKPVAKTTARTRKVKPMVEPEVDPLANIRLVIYFKDGSTVDRPMTEVFKFSVERAILTVISKDGSIGRYRMADVLRVSIE